ncbi:MAG: SusD/RagB family nutrient-binding outer membrane lipoprotein [Bacteroidetes bacterium]|nr:SusD/RagB family nutrient-binding outer membrane lipoprotein [Bacteroidota bacterium]
MKKILIILMTFLIIASCTKLEDLNKDTKNPTEVPGVTLFSNAQKNLADQIASTNVNLNVFKLWAEYWTETTYTDEANYNIINRTISDNAWRVWYRNVLMDFKEAGIVIAATEYATSTEEAEAANQLVINDIMMVFAWERMVTLWGNIPYGAALDIDNIQPVYEDAATIYSNLLTRLETDIAALDENNGSFGGADFIYHGDVSAWKKFANTLKLKMGTVIKDAGVVSSAMGGAFSSNADNANFVYLDSPPNTNPLYVDLVLSGRQDFVATTLITDYMNPLEDPRRPAYFTLAPDTNVYLGGVYGASSPYALYSHVADDIATVPTFPCTILSYVEVEFYLAEYYARQDDPANAEAHYNAGITASFDFWGTEGIADYLANPDVAYSTAYDTWQETIATQAWIAFYNNGYLGWTEWRRLGFPVLPLAADAYVNSIPTRFTYPVFEQTLNGDNYTAAASAIGGDLLTTKLWFAK